METGWICPRCETVHSPDVKRCDACAHMAKPRVPDPQRPEYENWRLPMWNPGSQHECYCRGGSAACGNIACPLSPRVTCQQSLVERA
jgi:hypothetical protein